MTPLAIAVHDLCFAYPDGHTALRQVGLQVRAGESVAVIGGNGAGKSTLLLQLNGFLRPSSGTVHIHGAAISRGNLREVRRTVGLVLQDPDDQLFMATVREDVAFGPTQMGLHATEVNERVAQALARVHATHLAERPPYRLSGGEKRAVAIAGILAMDPTILVMDEPSAGLDPAARRRLIGLLQTLPHTKVIATHDLALVLETANRVVVMGDGRIEADGTPDALFSDSALLQRCHLEAPPGWGQRAQPP